LTTLVLHDVGYASIVGGSARFGHVWNHLHYHY